MNTVREEGCDNMVKVNNLPENHNRYVVARRVDEDLWYWGSFADKDRANAVAMEISGEVIDYEEIRC